MWTIRRRPAYHTTATPIELPDSKNTSSIDAAAPALSSGAFSMIAEDAAVVAAPAASNGQSDDLDDNAVFRKNHSASADSADQHGQPDEAHSTDPGHERSTDPAKNAASAIGMMSRPACKGLIP